MSLASTLRKAAYAAPLAFALAAANANAAQTIELDTVDLSKPLPSHSCFVTNDKGTAFEKLTKAMNARSQTIVATADRVFPTGKAAQLFTSARDGSDGYDIKLNTPKDRMKDTDQACFSTITGVDIYNVYNQSSVPAKVNKGEVGVGLTNSGAKGTKVLMAGVMDGKLLHIVTYNPADGHGAVTLANMSGNLAGPASYVGDLAYSKKARDLLGIDQSLAMAPRQP